MSAKPRPGGGPRALVAGALPADGVELPDSAAVRRAEAAAQASRPPHALMAQAGEATARWALALLPHARHWLVVAGPGGNGGDGLVAARHLLACGRRVDTVWLGDRSRPLPDDVRRAAADARAAGLVLRSADDWPAQGRVDGVVDALLGLGASRAPAGALADAIGRVNDHGAPVLAVDLPSGLHPDTGARLGAAAVVAAATLCLLSAKRGCFTADGRDHAGAVWLDDLGVPPPAATDVRLAGPATARARRHASHKGSHGDVVVVGGAVGMAGAAALAVRAAVAAGAGRVYAVAPDLGGGQEPLPHETMRRAPPWLDERGPLDAATVVAGCGGGTAIAALLPALLQRAPRIVLDADALNAVAADASLRQRLRARRARGMATILTPHPLEAARCLGCDTATVQRDRVAAARALGEALGCTVVLKGSGTVTAATDGRAWINPTGNPALAGAGSGDVLAGWIGGGWAQRDGADPSQVAVDAVWLHGWAADRSCPGPGEALAAGDLVVALAAAVRALPPALAGR